MDFKNKSEIDKLEAIINKLKKLGYKVKDYRMYKSLKSIAYRFDINKEEFNKFLQDVLKTSNGRKFNIKCSAFREFYID
ncbi:hypothetical protein NWE60_05630 [Mycoplasmopsis felis]|uniref:hypothetical protein n=1 Tax=Mycoplasmopsis felis TaxID=33923 RepID=UPI0021B03E00|nr:hypothetical protein [Mycoplasmopsis felis]MCU9938429.1 hypothetical protein [Mycoplasmopsis felis]UWV79640.1 hypothetical protein NW072_00160 [Mycoplasmopsis felis]WAM00875.1 hypothetical protein NWE60_05630 [Mycoplasmopsis felis]